MLKVSTHLKCAAAGRERLTAVLTLPQNKDGTFYHFIETDLNTSNVHYCHNCGTFLFPHGCTLYDLYTTFIYSVEGTLCICATQIVTNTSYRTIYMGNVIQKK